MKSLYIIAAMAIFMNLGPAFSHDLREIEEMINVEDVLIPGTEDKLSGYRAISFHNRTQNTVWLWQKESSTIQSHMFGGAFKNWFPEKYTALEPEQVSEKVTFETNYLTGKYYYLYIRIGGQPGWNAHEGDITCSVAKGMTTKQVKGFLTGFNYPIPSYNWSKKCEFVKVNDENNN